MRFFLYQESPVLQGVFQKAYLLSMLGLESLARQFDKFMLKINKINQKLLLARKQRARVIVVTDIITLVMYYLQNLTMRTQTTLTGF